MAIGLGEAGCLPASHSLIGDYVPADRRGWGVSIFQGGGILGMSAGLILSAYLTQTIGWRNTMVAIGLAGLPIAILTLIVLENPTREVSTQADSPLVTLKALRRHVYLLCANAVAGFGTYGMSQWGVAYFVRTYGFSLAQTGLLRGWRRRPVAWPAY